MRVSSTLFPICKHICTSIYYILPSFGYSRVEGLNLFKATLSTYALHLTHWTRTFTGTSFYLLHSISLSLSGQSLLWSCKHTHLALTLKDVFFKHLTVHNDCIGYLLFCTVIIKNFSIYVISMTSPLTHLLNYYSVIYSTYIALKPSTPSWLLHPINFSQYYSYLI